MEFARTLNLLTLLDKKSHFLFGPRGTGKTSLVRQTLEGSSTLVIDLLKDDIYNRLLRRPSTLEELLSPSTSIVIIDEIQRVPSLLNEVHRLIEEKKLRFLLTRSSARKLRHGAVNLLGGRAWESRLFPLTTFELGERFDLIKYINRGGLPAIYLSDYPEQDLKNYINLYIRDEIKAEALVKRLDHFVRFLDIAALANGEELNFESIANDSGVPARTVASYFELLEDTLLGFQVPPFTKTKKRKAIKRSKFYFFDVGVVGALTKRGVVDWGSEIFGRAFEHFVAQELRAYLSYRDLDLDLCYWRSTTQFEVDFVIGNKLALEVKATERVGDKHLSGLKALGEEGLIKRKIIVTRDPMRRRIKDIEVIPWQDFVRDLWKDKLL